MPHPPRIHIRQHLCCQTLMPQNNSQNNSMVNTENQKSFLSSSSISVRRLSTFLIK